MDNEKFSRIVLTAIAASGKPKRYFWKNAGLVFPSQFSNMLNGDQKWLPGAKQYLIDVLDLAPILKEVNQGRGAKIKIIFD